MNKYKDDIRDKICYTELVYKRINKKLNKNLSNDEIEEMIFAIVEETDDSAFIKVGKNIYVTCTTRHIRLTINSFTKRIITADYLNNITRHR